MGGTREYKMNTTTLPPQKMTQERASKIVADRKRGLWNSQDTIDDFKWNYVNKAETDIAMTMFRLHERFAYVDKAELASEIKRWKKLGLVCWSENVKEIDIDGLKKWVFVIQDPKWNENPEKAPMCPLFGLTGIMVSGFTYITGKNVADWVVECLKENTQKALANGWGDM